MLQGSMTYCPAFAVLALALAVSAPACAQLSADASAGQQIVGDVLPQTSSLRSSGEAVHPSYATRKTIDGKQIVPVLSLVGRGVSNLQGERVGAVRDVVFGATDGVVRAVLAVRNPGPGESEVGLVAVPLSAFRLTEDDKLIVNASIGDLAVLPQVTLSESHAAARPSGLLVPETEDSPLFVVRPRSQGQPQDQGQHRNQLQPQWAGR